MLLPRYPLPPQHLWQFRKYSTSRADGEKTPNGWIIRRLVSVQFAKIREINWFPLLRDSNKLEYLGPTARIPHFFRSRDSTILIPYLFKSRDPTRHKLETIAPQSWVPRPYNSHDLLEAASKVGLVEAKIGYTFNNKMTCIEAIKTSKRWSLYFQGTTIEVGTNQRLALLGDRALALALCDMWFQTGRNPRTS